MKHFLFVMQCPPFQGAALSEKLDVLLSAAAFDQKVSLLFLDAGVFQLKKHQHPEAQQARATLETFNSLGLYDIHNLYVEYESLLEQGLKAQDLNLPAQIIQRRKIGQLMQSFDLVF